MIRVSLGFPTLLKLERRPDRKESPNGFVYFSNGWVFRLVLCSTPFYCRYRAVEPVLTDARLTLAGVSLRWLRYC